MLALCPHGEFISCLSADLQRRYKVHALFKPRELPWREPVQNAQRVFRRLGRNCTAAPPPQLSCASRSVDLDAQLLMMIGVPSGASRQSAQRRHEARATWMTSPQVGSSVGVCFLLSAYGELPPRGEGWAAEAEENGDVLLLQVAETRQLLTANTRYSNYTRHGRGMPTFKQFAFFRHAATLLPRVAYIGKIDDDTAVNLRLLVPILQLARCLPHVLVGSVQLSAF
jgi:hypothetical protein